MKRILSITVFLFGTALFFCQKHPSNLRDLQYFIGESLTEIPRMMKSQGYPVYDKNDDETVGGYLLQYFEGVTEEPLQVYSKNNTIYAVKFEDFSDSEAAKIIAFIKENDFRQICGKPNISAEPLNADGVWTGVDGNYKVEIKTINFFGVTGVTVTVAAESYKFECENNSEGKSSKTVADKTDISTINGNDLAYVKSFFAEHFVKSKVTSQGDEQTFNYKINNDGIVIYVHNISAPKNIYRTVDEWFFLPFDNIKLIHYSTNKTNFDNSNALRFGLIDGYIQHGPGSDHTKVELMTRGSGWLHIPFRYKDYAELDEFEEILANTAKNKN
ncbi:hypothetical protein [Kaistella palustris]|uniref:hypothetical protein n=1 Tax=Kaistella palustris TaxID=493376 RepID=UPI00047FCF8C|nr:hypothetical protein [Kaistella palustris]